jgi:oligogalacturonide transporter
MSAAADIDIAARAVYDAQDMVAVKEQSFRIADSARHISSRMSIVQGDVTKRRMKILFVSVPVILLFLGIIFAMKFRITPKFHDVLVKEIERLRSGGRKEDVDPETKKVCEVLTGHPYESLWR